jgi:hypothetical protein
MKIVSSKTSSILRRVLPVTVAVLSSAAVVAACDDKGTPTGGEAVDVSKLQFDQGGVVSGIDDRHCDGADAGTKHVVNYSACGLGEGGTVTTKSGTDGGTTADAGAEESAATLYNNIGFDDDCKYQVKWEASTIKQKKDVYFQVTLQATANNNAVTGANPYVEGFLDSTHPALDGSTKPTATEITAGTYVIGPYQFDAAGQWTARFHFFGDCPDSPDSPHGHVAFFVAVPAEATAGDK